MKYLKLVIFSVVAFFTNMLVMFGFVVMLYSVFSLITTDLRINCALIALILLKSHYVFYFLCKITAHILVKLFYQPSIKHLQELQKALSNKKPFILAPSHFTFVDAFFIFYVMPWRPRPIRFAVWYTYYFALWTPMWLTGCVPMAGKNDSALILQYANWNITRILSKQKSRCIICVFPEGTLNESKQQLCLVKKGVENWVNRVHAQSDIHVLVLPLALKIHDSFFSRIWCGKLVIPKPVDLIFSTTIENCTTYQLAQALSSSSGLQMHPEQAKYCGLT